jgi:hypothetical protein
MADVAKSIKICVKKGSSSIYSGGVTPEAGLLERSKTDWKKLTMLNIIINGKTPWSYTH